MTALHIVQGGIDNGDKTWIEKSARDGGDSERWVVPKNATPGDEVVIYIGGYGFFATATIKTPTEPRIDWPGRYGAILTAIELIEPAISLAAIIRHIPLLTWANYPRSITTPSSGVAAGTQRLIKNRRSTGKPDLDDESLAGANIDELRKVALLAVQRTVPAKERKALFRAGSIAIKRFVIRRANGICEACKEPAPFCKPDGSPYLEPHHTQRLADDGPDHPQSVIALCPNCHRRAHHSKDASIFNKLLIKALLKIEP